MGKPVISVEHLTKRYDLGVIGTGTVSRDLNRWWARLRKQPDPYLKIGQADHGNRAGESILALDNVSFTVEQGEVLGIIGRNGAGKSTLLKILSQVTAPTSGKVKVKGRIGSLLEVGTGFHPELTGRENVYLNGAILGMSKAEVDRKFDEIVDFSGVKKFIDTPVKRYSSGMYVRLAFAVAAHLEPEILIVDEVLAVGDAEFQKKCLGKMGDVAHEGRTVLFVSHNMAAIESLCPKALLLQSGSILFKGEVGEAISQYLEPMRNFDVAQKQLNGSVLKKVIILDKNKTETNKFFVGDPIALKLFLDASEEKISQPKIGIGINTINQQRISTVGTYFSDKFTPEIKGKVVVECVIPAPNISPGTYCLKIAFGSGTQDIDVFENCLSFTVLDGDYFGNGRLPNQHQGFLLLNSHWTVSQVDYE